MFVDRFIPKKYNVRNEVFALEALVDENGITYYFILLKSSGKKINVILNGSIQDLADLPKKVLKSKVPIVLILNGKGIIMKKVNLQIQEQEFNEIAEQNLPAVNKEEVFIQIFKQEDQTAFISICRKQQVNSILKDLIDNKYDVANVLLGSSSAVGLKPVWDNFNRFSTSIHSVELCNGNIEAIQNGSQKDEKIQLEGLELEKENVLGFSAGLSYLMQSKICESINPELNELAINHTEKNKLKVLILSSVCIAFLAAIINVLLYTNYFDKDSKLETELSIYQGKYDQINKLMTVYQDKKDLIENAGILNKNKLSEYADKIGATIPDELILSSMHFSPKNEDVESEDSLVTFETKQLIIKGNCNKSLVVNEWLNVLKMQRFVKDVSLEKFTYNKETILPNFEIKILTN